MANEIKVDAKLQVDNGNFHFPKVGQDQVQVTQASPGGGVPGTVVADNSADGVTVPTTGLTTLGWLYMRNLDLVSTVEWGPLVAGTLHVIGIMEPGEPALFRLSPGKVLALKSSAATAKVLVAIMED